MNNMAGPGLHQMIIWCNLVTASAAGGVPLCHQQWPLAVGSYPVGIPLLL
jgi:hypothetical protein